MRCWAPDKIVAPGCLDLKSFFMGNVTRRLLEYQPICPVWIVEGGIHSPKVRFWVDNSENALKAVDHARFTLSGAGAEH
jgi:hypothetical protein